MCQKHVLTLGYGFTHGHDMRRIDFEIVALSDKPGEELTVFMVKANRELLEGTLIQIEAQSTPQITDTTPASEPHTSKDNALSLYIRRLHNGLHYENQTDPTLIALHSLLNEWLEKPFFTDPPEAHQETVTVDERMAL